MTGRATLFLAVMMGLTPAAAEARSRSVQLAGEATVLAEWRKAENRASCAPLAFLPDPLTAARFPRGTVRRAYFGGGWAVAFDLPDERSAYGVAGVGLLPRDDDAPAQKRRELARQWPYVRELAQPGGQGRPGFAGYGMEGAMAYPPGNPQGLGANSLAYVTVDGQTCLYNVWSRLGRSHLELLLDSLRPLKR